MVFNSYSFLLFFPIVLVLTQLAPTKWRNGLLLLASYAFYASETFDQLGTFKFCFAACLPLVAIIFFFLARKGVKHDEDLIKSMDRIR